MTDQDHLVRSIVENPREDTPRLMYADWLDGNASEQWLPCYGCDEYVNHPDNPYGRPGYRPERDPASGRHEGGWTNCKLCNDTAHHPGQLRETDGRKELAEFIRVQIELSTFDDAYFLSFNNLRMCNNSAVPLIKRSAELLRGAWSRYLLDFRRTAVPALDNWVFRRGFPVVVYITHNAFTNDPDTTTKLFASLPIESVRFIDKLPGASRSMNRMNQMRWGWGGYSGSWGVGQELFAAMYPSTRAYDHESEEAAIDHLSAAAVAVGRKRARITVRE